MIKAIWTGPEQLEILEDSSTPAPEVPPDQVRIRITAAGVCGTDIHIWEGRLAIAKPPLVLGHEFAGVVEECGDRVRGLSPGDRVKCDSVVGCGTCAWCRRGAMQFCPCGFEFGVTRDGAWTERLVAPARNLHHLPASISDEVGAVLDVEVLNALRKASVRPGETVAIFGAGPAGLIALQCARILGAGNVILCGTRRERLELGLRLGADHAVDVHAGDAPSEVRTITGGEGVDLAFEAVGAERAILDAIEVLRPQGRAVFYGVPDHPIAEFPLQKAVLKDLTLYGSLPDRTGWDEMIALVAAGRLDLASLITHRFPLEEAATALATMRDRRDGAIKAVLRMNALGE